MPKITKNNPLGAGRKALPFKTMFVGAQVNIRHRHMFDEIKKKVSPNNGRIVLEQMIEREYERVKGKLPD